MICDQCGRKFQSLRKLKSHQANYHIDVELKTCQVCHQVFSTLSSKNRHTRKCDNAISIITANDIPENNSYDTDNPEMKNKITTKLQNLPTINSSQ